MSFDALMGFWGFVLFCFGEMDRLHVTRFGRLVWAVSFLGYASGVVDRFCFLGRGLLEVACLSVWDFSFVGWDACVG